jgi:regulator of replication initiation timing
MLKSEVLKLRNENEQLRAELLKVTTKLDCALENNTTLNAQMKDLQEKLDIIINQFNKQKKNQHSSKNEHHNPRQAQANAKTSTADSDEADQPSANGGVAPAPSKKSSRQQQKTEERPIEKQS